MKNIRSGIKAALVALAASVALVACGGGGGSGVSNAPAVPTPGGGAAPATSGTLRVSLTDAPACGYDEVNVTVERVRVHQSSAASDGDGGWVEIPVVNGPRKIDLLSLTNGVLMELGETTEEAIEAALTAQDFDRAAALIEQAIEQRGINEQYTLGRSRASYRTLVTRYLRERTTEMVGAAYAVHWPYLQPVTSRGVRRSALHDRLAARGACFGVVMGWERANWYATAGVEPERSCSIHPASEVSGS